MSKAKDRGRWFPLFAPDPAEPLALRPAPLGAGRDMGNNLTVAAIGALEFAEPPSKGEIIDNPDGWTVSRPACVDATLKTKAPWGMTLQDAAAVVAARLAPCAMNPDTGEVLDRERARALHAAFRRHLSERQWKTATWVEEVWLGILVSGVIPGRPGKYGTVTIKTADIIARAEELERAGKRRVPGPPVKPQHVGALLGPSRGGARGMNFPKYRTKCADGKYHWEWTIMPLDEARGRWDGARGKVDWPDDGGEWDVLAVTESM